MINELIKLTYKKIFRTNPLIPVLFGLSFLVFLYLAIFKGSTDVAMTTLVLILPYLGLLLTSGMIKDEIELRHLDNILPRIDIKKIFLAKFLAIGSIVVLTLSAALIFGGIYILLSHDASDFSGVLRTAFKGLILSLNLIVAGLFLSSWLKGQLNFVFLFFTEFAFILFMNKAGWLNLLENWPLTQTLSPKLMLISLFFPLIVHQLDQWPIILLLVFYSLMFLFFGYLRFKFLGLKNSWQIVSAGQADNDFSLKIKELEKSYPAGLFKTKRALNGLSFSVGLKKITGFLGPNGAGKTTALRIIMGFLKPDKGVIEFCVDGNGKPEVPKIGYLSETPFFFPFLTAREILDLTARLEKIKPDNIEKLIEKTVNRLDLTDYLHQKIKTLSKGTLQKLALSLATIGDPEILILDEPYTGLDPIVMNEIRKYILELREDGKTLFLSSHLLPEVERICDETVLINKGRVVCQGKVADLKWKWRIFQAAKSRENVKQWFSQKKGIDVSDKNFAYFLGNDLEELLAETIIYEEASKISEPDLEAVFLESVKRLDA